MSQIYYCPNCKKTFSSDEPAYICSNCGGSLIATGVPVEAWRSFSDQEKELVSVLAKGLRGE